MRFNKQELITLAALPSNKFEKEGILNIIEKQEGFFTKREGENNIKVQKITRRKTLSCIGGIGKVSFPRWCKLRGNLLFYLKDDDPFSTPLGLIVLENCRSVIRSESRDIDGYSFFIEFRDGLSQRIAANTEAERSDWMNAIQMASYAQLNKQLKFLRDQIEKKLGHNEGASTARQNIEPAPRQKSDMEIDITEIPLCESAVSCDNLLCDGHGRPPNPSIDVQVENSTGCGWIKYGQTEVIDRCANPQFLCTIMFRASDGLSSSSLIRFTVYDVREKLSKTAIPLGNAEISLGVIQDTTRIRIPLRSVQGNAGFITIASWAPDQDKKTPRSPAKIVENQNLGHRRSQSLPPKLGVKLFVPPQGKLSLVFANPSLHTYRLHSGLGGDISVQELMMESQLCYIIPQQLLSMWILREKELLQEISGMGELGGEWRNKQMDLLDKHLKLLKDYSQAKQNLLHYNSNNDKYFKPSANKTDESLEFVPVNLHLQRMWAHNDTLKRSGVLDIISTGAFTRHAGKSKTGGLIKLLQQNKDSPSKLDTNSCKVQAANDVVQAIKQLRKEIVEIMSQLLCLAKMKNPKGMMPLCNEMVNKTRTLLNLWEPNLVEEAFAFIEQHRILDEPDNTLMPLSPFKKITQQLGALDLKSPDLEDFATPMGAPPDLWPSRNNVLSPNRNSNLRMKSPSATDINTISSIQQSVQIYTNQSRNRQQYERRTESSLVHSLPIAVPSLDSKKSGLKPNQVDQAHLKFSETHFDVSGEISTSESQPHSLVSNEYLPDDGSHESLRMNQNDVQNEHKTIAAVESNDNGEVSSRLAESKHEILHQSTDFEESDYMPMNCSIVLGHNGAFLDTKMMSSSPSANYYRPTEEPEPLDLTQLNIEASVMCLVSKVKFLCGRCGSPAVRLRQPRNSVKRGFNSMPPDVVTSQPIAQANYSMSSVSQSTTETSQQPESLGSMSQTDSLISNSGHASNVESSASVNLNSKSSGCMSGKDLNLALTQAVGEVTRRVKKGNKFTDGLDLSMTTDWASELRPSMRKLRQAMDGLLKTARLIHSVQRLQQDMKKISTNLAIMYRRDVCFSQALTALVSGIMAKLWGSTITENHIQILSHLGPLAYFEGLLSLYGGETDMWGDMCVAIEDLSAVNFTLIRSDIQRETKTLPIPRIVGSRHSLTVLLPVPENVYSIIPTKGTVSFKVTPVFFNIGINERATLSETLGYTREQHRSNWDNYDRIKSYHIRYKKLNLVIPDTPSKSEQNVSVQTVADYLNAMEESLRSNTSKNVKILHLAEDICRAMNGLRFTSCKSGKDRTGMAVTLEESRILQQEFHLPASSLQNVLNTMRSEGTRIDNVVKNIRLRKYAFNLPQVLSLPALYRPPAGAYGKAQT